MAARFEGKVVAITGGSAGVGAACARAFAREGAKLVLAARGADALEALARDLRPHPVITLTADVASDEDCRRIVTAAEERFGALHVLVNNAGYNARGDFESLPASELARVIDVNLRSPIVMSRLALPLLRSSGGGAIVNVASLAGRTPLPHAVVYSASKFGLRAFSLALNEELRGTGVTVSVVSPGPLFTGFLLDNMDVAADIVFSQPMRTAEQVAGAVLACAADGTPERALPRGSGALATLGYLWPTLSRALRPLLEAHGRRVKQKLRRQQS